MTRKLWWALRFSAIERWFGSCSDFFPFDFATLYNRFAQNHPARVPGLTVGRFQMRPHLSATNGRGFNHYSNHCPLSTDHFPHPYLLPGLRDKLKFHCGPGNEQFRNVGPCDGGVFSRSPGVFSVFGPATAVDRGGRPTRRRANRAFAVRAPDIITVGRGGSPGDVNRESRALKSREIEVIYANRGGGCLLHCPGQLAIYPLVPLAWHGFTVGDFLERLQVGIVETLDDLGIRGHIRPGRHGIWGTHRTIGGRGRGRAKLGYILRGVFERRSAPGPVPRGRVRYGGSYAHEFHGGRTPRTG